MEKVEVLLLIGILILAFWQKDMIIWLISGLVTIFLSVLWIDDYTGVVIAFWCLGVYQLLKAAMMALEVGGPARGLSQFKAMWQKARRK